MRLKSNGLFRLQMVLNAVTEQYTEQADSSWLALQKIQR